MALPRPHSARTGPDQSNLSAIPILTNPFQTTTNTPLLVITCKRGPYFDLTHLTEDAHTRKSTHGGPHTHTHTQNTPVTSYLTMDCPIPCNRGPVLNTFLCYLRSPKHNRKPRTFSVGGVSTVYRCVSWSKSSFAGICKCVN